MTHSTSNPDDRPRLGPVGELATRHQTVAFFALTLALTWTLWVPAALGLVGDSPVVGGGLFFLGAFGPPVAAVTVTWLTGRRVWPYLVEALCPRVSPRWYLLALILPVAYFAVPNAVVYAALGRPFDPSLLPVRVGAFLVGVVAVTLVGGGQEELGWRGFALPRLQSDYGPVPATVAVGVAWAPWHLPLSLTGWRSASVPFPAYLLMVVGMAFFFTWLYNVSGSVLVVMVLHGAQNAANGLLPVSASEALTAPFPLPVVVGQVLGVWVPVALLLWVVGPSLGFDGTSEDTRTPPDDGPHTA
jgi:membrane protease YdiL (CAAX protease family)